MVALAVAGDRHELNEGKDGTDDVPVSEETTKRPVKGDPDTFWYVAPRQQEDGFPDINFSVAKAGCPQEQRDLKKEIERALSVINVLYSGEADSRKRAEAFAKLLSLSCVGLVGKNASPDIAMDALRALEADIVARESGLVKNNYMRKLGATALAFALFAIVPFFILDYWSENFIDRVVNNRFFFILWAGCMLGTWLSFATRKVILGFHDLVVLEEDRIDPALRLLFSGFLTVLLGLIFKTGMANVEIGSFSAAGLMGSASIAFLIGAFAGLSEKALPSAIVSRAGDILNTK